MQTAFPHRRAAPGWPLLATLGVHLLLAWGWQLAHPPAPAPGPGRERVIDLVPVPTPAPAIPHVRRPPPPRPPISVPRAPAGRISPAPAREEEPAAPPFETAPTVADPFAESAPSAPAPPSLESMVGRARSDARLIDRELRKGKSGVPEVADTRWGRFTGALEGAYKDRSRGVTSETYTAPDGQVIYRFRRNGKYMCRSGGSVGPKIGGAVGGGEVLFDVQGGGGRAGEVQCPTHAEWKAD